MISYRRFIALFVITAEEVEMSLDPGTFYLNEEVNIQCTTSFEFNTKKNHFILELHSTSLAVLPPQTTSSPEGPNESTGCSYQSKGLWAGTDRIWHENLITENDCVTAAQSAPFTITVQPTVTEQLRGVKFWCFAAAHFVIKTTARTTIEIIKGELFSFTVSWKFNYYR